MIAGTGIDLVDVKRMQRLLSKWGERFTGRYFSPGEIAYCRQKASSATHYAARFAAKEAFLKSLGIGLGMGVGLRDIEIVNDDRGKPELIVYGEAQRILSDRGIRRLHVSLTHTTESAGAIVILEA
jgi:holo-[acyl-carrier protein] synthase